MNRPFRTLTLAGTLAGALAFPALAQDPNAGTPPPAEEGMLLQFKHKTGQMKAYKATVKIDAAVTPEGNGGGGGGIGPIPVSVKSIVAFQEKVVGTRQGTGTISMPITSLLATQEAAIIKAVVKYQNGKLTTSINGKPQPASASEAGLAELKKPATVKRDPLGKVTPVGNPSNAIGQLFGSSSYTLVQFSGMPVKVGDTWETVEKIRPTVIGGRVPFVIPEIEFRYTHTLKSIQERNGRKTALIETSGSGSTAGGGAAENELSQSVTGTTRFDIARGTVVSSQHNVILSLLLGNPGGQAAGGPASMRLDGTMDVVVSEAPTPAAAKKPVKKRR